MVSILVRSFEMSLTVALAGLMTVGIIFIAVFGIFYLISHVGWWDAGKNN